MNKRLRFIIILLLIPLVSLVLFYGGFALLLILSDQAFYHGNEVYVGPIDYNLVLANAKGAGYSVSDSWERPGEATAIEPGRVEALEKRFKTDYLVHRIELYYNESTVLEFCKYENRNMTTITLTNFSSGDSPLPENYSCGPMELSRFPDDQWMLEMFKLGFGLEEKGALEYLEKLKAERVNHQEFAQMEINKSVDFPAVYAYLTLNNTNSSFHSGMWNDEEFYRNGKKLGYVAYLVPEASITTSWNFNKYSLEVNCLGFSHANILMHRASSGKEIPKEEYRAVFKEMFKDLGLPPEKVDEFEFEYNNGVW